MNRIIIDTKTMEKRFAVVEDGMVVRLFVQQPKDISEVGNIYSGRVESVKSGIDAAFVNYGGEKNGYLHRDQLPAFVQSTDADKHRQPISKYIREGDRILVQVRKDETERKGAMLTGLIELQGHCIVFVPEANYTAVSKKGEPSERAYWKEVLKSELTGWEGAVVRTEAFGRTEDDLREELNRLRGLYNDIISRAEEKKAPALLYEKRPFQEEIMKEMIRLKNGEIAADAARVLRSIEAAGYGRFQGRWKLTLHYGQENIFSAYNIEAEIEKALKRIVWLDQGAYLVIDETEAATVIDVNTGKFTGKQQLASTIVKTNLAAAREIGRQIRLRDYGGMILVDFIGMEDDRDRRLVKRELESALEKDPVRTKAIGFTPLGIFEITRKRTRHSLSDTLRKPCPVCRGAGKTESAESAAFRLERELWEEASGREAVLIDAEEEVIELFSGPRRRHAERLEEALKMKIFFRKVCGLDARYRISQFGTAEQLANKAD